jgi:hypothetical protein
MSIWDDLGAFMGHLAHGDLSRALGDAENAVDDVLGGTSDSQNEVQQSASAQMAAMQAAANAKKHGGGTVVPPPPAGRSGAGPACCDRFTFSDGFLVDGASGSVWKFNPDTKKFEEIPVVRDPIKQTLIDTMIENRLNIFRSRYECEVLATVTPSQRPAKLSDFEKTYLDPLRSAAKALMY